MRISEGLCIVYTAQWPGKWNLVLSACSFFLRAVGACQEKRWTERKSQSTNNTAHCLSNWQTVTGSWHILPNRGLRLGRGCGRRQHILLSVPEMFFYMDVSCNFHQQIGRYPVWPKHLDCVWMSLSRDINQLKKQKRNVTQYFGSYLIRGIQCWTIYMRRSYRIIPMDSLKNILPRFFFFSWGTKQASFGLEWKCVTLISYHNWCSSAFIRCSFQTIKHCI